MRAAASRSSARSSCRERLRAGVAAGRPLRRCSHRCTPCSVVTSTPPARATSKRTESPSRPRRPRDAHRKPARTCALRPCRAGRLECCGSCRRGIGIAPSAKSFNMAAEPSAGVVGCDTGPPLQRSADRHTAIRCDRMRAPYSARAFAFLEFRNFRFAAADSAILKE